MIETTKERLKVKWFEELTIEKPIISIFCSGESLDRYDTDQLDGILDNTFSIAVNFSLASHTPDMRVWSDYAATNIMREHPEYWKGSKLCCRSDAFSASDPFMEEIDYIFDVVGAEIKGVTTVTFMLQLLTRRWPDRMIQIYGLDGSGHDRTSNCHFAPSLNPTQVDDYVDALRREKKDLEEIFRDPESRKNIYNFSSWSSHQIFQIVDDIA